MAAHYVACRRGLKSYQRFFPVFFGGLVGRGRPRMFSTTDAMAAVHEGGTKNEIIPAKTKGRERG